VKFLIDNALSPEVARLLSDAGHDAVHVRDYGLQAASDLLLLELAEQEDRILVSAGTDFAALLTVGRKPKPSLILFREPDVIRARDYVARILSSLSLLKEELETGCVVVFRHGRLRVRTLPFGASQPRWSAWREAVSCPAQRVNRPRTRSQFANSRGHSASAGSFIARPTPWGPRSKMCISAGTPALRSAR